MIKTLMLTMNKEYSIWCQTAGGLDMGEWERADCVFYLNAAIHHEVTWELTSHLRRLIMDPPLWIWLISSLFQIYYTLGPKVEMVHVRLQSTELFHNSWFLMRKLTTSTDLTIKVHIYSKLRTTIITLGKEINFQFNFVIWDFSL